MPQQVPTSFVPKQPVRPVRRPQAQGPLDIFAVAGLVLIAAALILAGLVFGYEWYLKREKEQKSAQIQTLQSSVDRLGVEQLGRLSQRLVVAQELLNAHIAPSTVFSMLERDTVQGVQFTDFGMTVGVSGDVELSVDGVARSFNALAYQSQIFGKNPFIRNQIFSEIDTQDDGSISFIFEGVASRNLLLASAGVVAPQEEAVLPEAVEEAVVDEPVNEVENGADSAESAEEITI